jgi:hypothetical protein
VRALVALVLHVCAHHLLEDPVHGLLLEDGALGVPRVRLRLRDEYVPRVSTMYVDAVVAGIGMYAARKASLRVHGPSSLPVTPKGGSTSKPRPIASMYWYAVGLSTRQRHESWYETLYHHWIYDYKLIVLKTHLVSNGLALALRHPAVAARPRLGPQAHHHQCRACGMGLGWGMSVLVRGMPVSSISHACRPLQG